ncbi:MAG TPA: 2-amino-4-hydroxy-6-hydroxymethyldihydropteridine diphosphokinase, partial [Exilispira sp.]|nr:2-amino-4-hydroxy-6-hydroxymethyldihydropteridine diphosphokinase [Exilispira sp.]
LQQKPDNKFCKEYYNEVAYHIDDYYKNSRLGKSTLENDQWKDNLSKLLYAAYTDKFFNQAVIIESELSPKKIIARISRIEKSLGQKRKDQLWGKRIIDIDVIYIENLVYYDSYIQIPHEGIYDRPYIKQLIKKVGWNYEKF